jgi:hypothetical protein
MNIIYSVENKILAEVQQARIDHSKAPIIPSIGTAHPIANSS